MRFARVPLLLMRACALGWGVLYANPVGCRVLSEHVDVCAKVNNHVCRAPQAPTFECLASIRRAVYTPLQKGLAHTYGYRSKEEQRSA